MWFRGQNGQRVGGLIVAVDPKMETCFDPVGHSDLTDNLPLLYKIARLHEDRAEMAILGHESACMPYFNQIADVAPWLHRDDDAVRACIHPVPERRPNAQTPICQRFCLPGRIGCAANGPDQAHRACRQGR